MMVEQDDPLAIALGIEHLTFPGRVSTIVYFSVERLPVDWAEEFATVRPFIHKARRGEWVLWSVMGVREDSVEVEVVGWDVYSSELEAMPVADCSCHVVASTTLGYEWRSVA